MVTTMRETSTNSHKTDRREKLIEDLNQLQLLGECITWCLRENRGIVNTHQSVIDSLKSAGLDEKMAKQFLPSQAFNRACTKLREERVIDIIRNDKDEILFQFSKRSVQDDVTEGGQEFLYQKEVKIFLNKSTGNLKCKDPTILEQAQKELDRCMEARTTTDVSNIVTKLCETNADLIPIGTGVYFVPQDHVSFLDKISLFLKQLGRKMQRFPVPAGTQRGDQSVQEAIANHLDNLLEGLNEAVTGFSTSTRDSTIEGVAGKINACRAKIQAYAVYLQDKSEDLLQAVDHANKRLMVKIELLDQERKSEK